MADTDTSKLKNDVKNFVKAVIKKEDELNAGKFVGKETGKSLMLDTDKTKLDGVATGAQVNVIESIAIKGGATQSIDSDTKVLTLDLDDYAKKTDVASAVIYKGSKETFAELPASGNTQGDMYNIKIAGGTDRNGTAIKAGDNVVYIEDETNPGWDAQGGTTDLSSCVQTETGKALSTNDFTTAYKDALDSLISGTDFTFDEQDVLDIFADDDENEGD